MGENINVNNGEQNNNQSEQVELTKEAVLEYLGSNVDAYKSVVEEYLSTEQGKNLIQPKLDSFFSKGLETWKINNLDKIVSEKVAELNPQETPEQRRIRELEEKLNRQETISKQSQIKNLAVNYLSEKKMPTSIAEYIKADTEEGVRNTINNLEIEWTLALDEAVTNRFKKAGTNPKGESASNTDPSAITKEKLLAMSLKETTDFYNKNPQLFRQLMGS